MQEKGKISSDLFRHHFISRDLAAPLSWGFGASALADFDRDGDHDYVVSVRDDSVYWFEFQEPEKWIRHTVGALVMGQLGGLAMDIDGDGWQDILIGGYWYRNPENPKTSAFERYSYDSTIGNEIHDIVSADMDGDGRMDVVVLGDGDGIFWYDIPATPRQDVDWPRHTITLDVLNDRDDIHGGFFPGGVADLDGDDDADVVLPDRWLENQASGTRWQKHDLPFGRIGPWGLSSRSWIEDMDRDGDADIVIVDNDQNGSSAAWLENNGQYPPAFVKHILPFEAPGNLRGSFHSLHVADFDNDGDPDIFAAEQEDDAILPEGAGPRAYIWENVGNETPLFVERVIFDGQLGAHDARVGDIDGDGDLDIAWKIWNQWAENANDGRFHADWLENLLVDGE